jgi:hypothetical protein
MFCALSMARMVRISSLHPRSTLAIRHLLMGGSRGNSAILRPSLVRRPSCAGCVCMCVGGGGDKGVFDQWGKG